MLPPGVCQVPVQDHRLRGLPARRHRLPFLQVRDVPAGRRRQQPARRQQHPGEPDLRRRQRQEVPAGEPHRAAADPQAAGLAGQPLARLLQLPGHHHHGGAAGGLALAQLRARGRVLPALQLRLGHRRVSQLDRVELHVPGLSDVRPGARVAAGLALLQLLALGHLLTGLQEGHAGGRLRQPGPLQPRHPDGVRLLPVRLPRVPRLSGTILLRRLAAERSDTPCHVSS